MNITLEDLNISKYPTQSFVVALLQNHVVKVAEGMNYGLYVTNSINDNIVGYSIEYPDEKLILFILNVTVNRYYKDNIKDEIIDFVDNNHEEIRQLYIFNDKL